MEPPNPNEGEARRARDMGRQYQRDGDLERAIRLLTKSIRLHPNPDTTAMLNGAKAAAMRSTRVKYCRQCFRCEWNCTCGSSGGGGSSGTGGEGSGGGSSRPPASSAGGVAGGGIRVGGGGGGGGGGGVGGVGGRREEPHGRGAVGGGMHFNIGRRCSCRCACPGPFTYPRSFQLMMMAAAIVALLAYRTTYGESPFQSVQSRYRNGDPPFRWPRAYTWHEYVFDDEDGGDGVDAYSYRSSRRRSGSGSDSDRTGYKARRRNAQKDKEDEARRRQDDWQPGEEVEAEAEAEEGEGEGDEAEEDEGERRTKKTKKKRPRRRRRRSRKRSERGGEEEEGDDENDGRASTHERDVVHDSLWDMWDNASVFSSFPLSVVGTVVLNFLFGGGFMFVGF